MKPETKALITAKKEASAKALKSARDIKAELDGIKIEAGQDPYKVWPSDKVEAFVKATDDATLLAEEAQGIERIAATEDKADALHEYHTRPVNSLPYIGSETRETDARKSAINEGFSNYLRFSKDDEAHRVLEAAGFSAKERHALISGNDTLGGYLVPDDFRAEVQKREAQMAVMRSICRVVPCASDVLVFPRIAAKTTSNTTIYSSDFAGAYRSETAGTEDGSVITAQNQPKFEQLRIPIHNWVPAPVVVSQSLIQDSAAPVEGILADAIAETKATDEDGDFLNGTGVNKPKGILADSTVPNTNSGSAGVVVYATLLDFIFGVPSQYTQGACMLMRRATFGKVLALEDTGTTIIFPPNAAPDTIHGLPVKYTDWMPAVASGAEAMLIGQFQKYIIADRQELRVQRLVERYSPNVGLQPMARFGGDVAVAEAFRTYTLT